MNNNSRIGLRTECSYCDGGGRVEEDGQPGGKFACVECNGRGYSEEWVKLKDVLSHFTPEISYRSRHSFGTAPSRFSTKKPRL